MSDDSRRDFFEKITLIEQDGTERKMTADEIDDVLKGFDVIAETTKDHDWKAAARQIENLVPDLVVEQLDGYVPIQGHGTYKGIEFYFRARYETATLSVGTYDEGGRVSSWMPRYQASMRVSDDEFGAGWMSPDEVVAIFPTLVEHLEPRTKEEGEATLDAFSKQVDDGVAMLRQADEIRNLDTTDG